MDEERDSKDVCQKDGASGGEQLSIADLLEEKAILIESLREHREMLIRVVDWLAPRCAKSPLVRDIRDLLKP